MAEVNYFWDEIEDNVIREYGESNNTIANYTTEPSVYGSVLSQERSGVTRYYHFDGVGNTTELTDMGGAVTDTRRYTAFGDVVQLFGSTDFSNQFCGQLGYQFDSSLSHYSVRHCKFANGIARWLSPDPLNVLLHQHSYRLSRNNPVNDRDPSGLMSITPENGRQIPCGGYSVEWKIVLDPSRLAPDVVVVQKICTSGRFVRDCEEMTCGCVPTTLRYCSEKCVYEVLGHTRPADPNRIWIPRPIRDTNLVPWFLEKNCIARGRGIDYAVIKVFRRTKKVLDGLGKFELPGAIDQSNECKNAITGIGYHTLDKPDFWHDADVILDVGMHDAVVEFDCCDARPNWTNVIFHIFDADPFE